MSDNSTDRAELRWAQPVLFVSRPFGVALALFIALNVALALKSPRLSASRVWLDVPLIEPWLSVFSALLGAALLIPHRWGRNSGVRVLQTGVFGGFLALALWNVASFYYRVETEEILSHALFPFSLVIALVLLLEIARVAWWGPVRVRLPRPARRFFGGVLVLSACFILIVAHIYTYGKTDFSLSRTADAVVVLGARAYPDGTLSHALEFRMERALELYRQQKVDFLIYSGGVDADNVSEPRMMSEYALRHEVYVPPGSYIIDETGRNTYRSALRCAEIARERRFDRVFVVSQYFHNARVKLIFERAGVECYTVPAGGRRLVREPFYLLREAIAYPYYLLFRYGVAGGGERSP